MQVDVIDLRFQGQVGAIAAFLVSGPSGKILIETGPESTLEVLVGALKDRGLSVSDLDAVFVTHIHLDHAGAAGSFAEKGVPVYVHTKGARHLVDPSRLLDSSKQVYGERFELLWGGMTAAPAEKVFEMVDGDLVEIGGMKIKAVNAPGHAFHQHAFVIDDVCFPGDAAGAKLQGSDFISVTSAPPQFHLGHTLETLDKLASYGFSRLFLTHYGEVNDVAEHLSRYREVVELNALFIRQRWEEGMDSDTLRVAYEAFQMEQAFREKLPPEVWRKYQLINGTDMCADGIRLYWEKELAGD